MLEMSAGIRGVIHMEQGEPDFRTPDHIVEAAMRALRSGATHYTDLNGKLELREAIAEKLRKDNGMEVNPKTEVTVTSGSQESMLVAALSFLNPGDEAIVLDPFYPAYAEDVILAEGVPVYAPLSKSGSWRVTAETLEERVSGRTRMIWLCNPSNPTGNVFSRPDLEAIAEVARSHDLLVFADEIYEKLTYDGVKAVSIASLKGMCDRTITVNGFSKAYAMTGWRLGYIAAPEGLSATIRKLHYYATLCPNSVSQEAGVAALMGPQDCVDGMVKEYALRRDAVLDGLRDIPSIRCSKPEGAFYVFPDLSAIEPNDEIMAQQLLQTSHLCTVPGSGFGSAGKGHLRISYSIPTAEVLEGTRRLKSGIESYRPYAGPGIKAGA